MACLALEHPDDDLLGDKAEHAKGQHQKQHEGAELAGFGFACELKNDEQHVQHEAGHAKGQPELGELFFCHHGSVRRGVKRDQVSVGMPAGMSQHGHNAEQP